MAKPITEPRPKRRPGRKASKSFAKLRRLKPCLTVLVAEAVQKPYDCGQLKEVSKDYANGTEEDASMMSPPDKSSIYQDYGGCAAILDIGLSPSQMRSLSRGEVRSPASSSLKCHLC